MKNDDRRKSSPQNEENIHKEWVRLRSVFSREEYPDSIISKQEGPDFIINSDEPFGVEITEYYIDRRRSGRFHNDQEYRSKVFDDPVNIQPKDRKYLEPVRVLYGDVIVWPKALYWALPTNVARVERLSQAIADKEEAAQKYEYSNPFDLIIYDAADDLFGGESGRHLFDYLKNVSPKGISSHFRKIYICKKYAFDEKDIIVLGN